MREDARLAGVKSCGVLKLHRYAISVESVATGLGNIAAARFVFRSANHYEKSVLLSAQFHERSLFGFHHEMKRRAEPCQS
jgi:hypothetical protein